MAKKQEAAPMTYKEIVCLAIKELDREIEEYEEKGNGKGAEALAIIASITEPLREKREKVKLLYLIETGVEYA